MEIAERSGASLADGAAAIIAGQIVKSFEDLEADGGMTLDKAAFAVAALRDGDLGKQKHKLAEEKHRLATEKAQLDREKFERQTCEAVMKAGKSKEIQEILGSGKTKAVQLDLIHAQLFGKAPGK
jgi:Na+/phosphate symporter